MAWLALCKTASVNNSPRLLALVTLFASVWKRRARSVGCRVTSHLRVPSRQLGKTYYSRFKKYLKTEGLASMRLTNKRTIIWNYSSHS